MGLHPPRLDSPPLSDSTWELIQTCWVREASKRPGIEVVVSTLAPDARYLDSESNEVSARTSATTTRPPRPRLGAVLPDGQSREIRHECAMCHKR